MEKFLTNKIPQNINIKTQRLTITEIKESDKDVYYKLYTDKELNTLWGYDYALDLGENPTAKDFFDLQNNLKKTEGEYAFAVRENGQMVGELVLYNPTTESVEIGFRFFKDCQGKGYATESATALIEYAKQILGIKVFRGRCFKQNAPSKALFLRLGFNQFSQNDTHYFFELKQ
jgi:RimJ/RimL family protein N-acetyltransferase